MKPYPDDFKYMKLAIKLAEKGWGTTSPNPMVGAVIVKDGKIVGKGFHRFAGADHAEIEAIKSAKCDLNGSTMYINLEPCNHFGKTPPCTKAIVESKIKKVVIGMIDPNPLVSGKGAAFLQKNGIEVITGVLDDDAKKLNEAFIKFVTAKIPFVALKVAESIDGKIATEKGESKWITSEASRRHAHFLRTGYGAIVVGSGTVIKDDPSLTVRLVKGKTKLKVIVDSKLSVPLNAKIFDEGDVIIAVTTNANKLKLEKLTSSKVKVWIFPEDAEGMVPLELLLKKLGENQVVSLLVEGGSRLASSFVKQRLADKIYCFIAPLMIGGKGVETFSHFFTERLSDASRLSNVNVKKFGEDVLIEGYLKG